MFRAITVWVLLIAVCTGVVQSQTLNPDSYRDNPWMMAFHPQKTGAIYCVTGNHGLVYTTDTGITWFEAGEGPGGQAILGISAVAYVYSGEERVIVHAARGTEASQLYFYNIASDTWDLISTDREWFWVDHIFTSPDHPDYIFVSGVEGCARYTISTDLWTSLPDQGDDDVTYFAVDPSDSDSFWQGTIPETVVGGRIFGRLYKSTDAGGTWEVKMPQTGAHISNMLFDPNDTNHLFIVSGLVYESFDGGETYITTHPTDTNAVWMPNFVVDWEHDRWYGAHMEDSVYVSTDFGVSWIPYPVTDEGSPRFVSNMYIHPHDPAHLFLLRTDGLYESFDYGVTWTRNLFTLRPTGIDDLVESAISFIISGPYPQPARSGDAVTFELSSSANGVIGVSLYNALGQELSRQEFDMTGGVTMVTIPTNSLQPGVYYCRFHSGRQQAARVILVK